MQGVTDNEEPANTAQTGKLQHSSFSDVASQSLGATIGLVRAERQFMGCLLREPGLFHMTLTDGRTLDEALTPAEMVTPLGRELYGLMYGHLADGRELSLAGLLGECAEHGLDELGSVAAQIEREVDAMMSAGGSGSGTLGSKLVVAAERIIAHHREVELAGTVERVDGASPDDALRKAMEVRRVTRSPLSIMRPRE